MKRRLLYASSQAYQPHMEVHRREVGWLEPPVVITREAAVGHRAIDLALVGRVREGVVVAIRGSLPPFLGQGHDGWAVLLDWLNDGLSLCVGRPEYDGAGIHLGFADSAARLWEDLDGRPGIRTAIQQQLDLGARRHLFVTGHSKGGALANLVAYRAAMVPCWRNSPISVATIAAARVGNAAFARAYARTRIACLRYEVPSDLVPHLPPGPHTPRWIRWLARSLVPRLASGDYHPVGVRVVAPEARQRSLVGAWLHDVSRFLTLRGLNPGALAPALVAHAISPQSHYDRLVCTGEDCDHGR
jgi:hypothetical protein